MLTKPGWIIWHHFWVDLGGGAFFAPPRPLTYLKYPALLRVKFRTHFFIKTFVKTFLKFRTQLNSLKHLLLHFLCKGLIYPFTKLFKHLLCSGHNYSFTELFKHLLCSLKLIYWFSRLFKALHMFRTGTKYERCTPILRVSTKKQGYIFLTKKRKNWRNQ